ncbi:hypothetical protein [Ornithinimicrobium kibberense]|uniref:hypothetical protein n=1 Tax=Ornithinimicrobium kibberense TaxID=282060 RepID=UPI0036146DFC
MGGARRRRGGPPRQYLRRADERLRLGRPVPVRPLPRRASQPHPGERLHRDRAHRQRRLAPGLPARGPALAEGIHAPGRRPPGPRLSTWTRSTSCAR